MAVVAGGLLLPRVAITGEEEGDHERARALKEAGTILPLRDVVANAGQDNTDRLIETKLEEVGNRYVYELEFVDAKGNVYSRYYDARTGAALSRQELQKEEDN